MKKKYFFGIFIFALILADSTLHMASAVNGTNAMNSTASNINPCSTGALNSQGLCSQPTISSQNNVNFQGGTIPLPQNSQPNTYWCKPGTTDSNLCTMKSTKSPSLNNTAVNLLGGTLSQGNSQISNGNSQVYNSGVNIGGLLSPNSLVGIFTNPNDVCSTIMMQSQGLCVNSQGLQGYYSPANCNFGIDPTTNQCSRVMNPGQNIFSQGILSQGISNTNSSLHSNNTLTALSPNLNSTISNGTSLSTNSTKSPTLSPGMTH